MDNICDWPDQIPIFNFHYQTDYCCKNTESEDNRLEKYHNELVSKYGLDGFYLRVIFH